MIRRAARERPPWTRAQRLVLDELARGGELVLVSSCAKYDECPEEDPFGFWLLLIKYDDGDLAETRTVQWRTLWPLRAAGLIDLPI